MIINEKKSRNIETPNPVTIEDLLGPDNKVYEIPLFQRNYNWNEDNCRELYDDIVASYQKGKPYFIGIFIHYLSSFSSTKTVNTLIDGQQRLTTILLLLCAIRDASNDKQMKEYINNKYITNKNKKEIPFKFKLKQNNFDNKNFESVLSNELDSVDIKSNIFINYNNFLNWLQQDKRKIDLKKLVKHIEELESVEIILKSDDTENVQEIFEKINSTGLELTAADLIRNHLLFTGDLKEQKSLYDKWTCIEKMVGSKYITQFVKSYTTRYSFEYNSSQKIYSSFKIQFKGQKHSKILTDMIKYAKYYAVIQYNNYYKVDPNNYEIELLNSSDLYNDNTLRMLKSLGTVDLIPFFMQLYSELYDSDKNKLSEIMEIILEFMIRYRIVAPSTGGGALNAKLYNIMKKIDNKECKVTPKGIYAELSSYYSDASVYPSNSQFVHSMRERMTQEQGRVLLYQLSRRKKNEIMDFSDKITLEHLMPQVIDPNKPEGKWWINNLGSTNYQNIREKYTDCIGNYALLTRSLNASISNGPWTNKRTEILNRAFDDYTRKVAEKEIWNGDSIKDRNNKFSEEIAKIITGPKDERKSNSGWLDYC